MPGPYSTNRLQLPQSTGSSILRTVKRDEGMIERTMRGFSLLTDPALLEIEPDRIAIVRVDRAATLRTFLLTRGIPDDRLEEYSLLNGRALDDYLESGVVDTSDGSVALRLAVDLVIVLVVVIGGRITPAFTRNALLREGIEPGVRSWPWLDRLAIASVVAVAADRAGWVAPRRLDRPAAASAPIAGTGCRTWQVSRATRNSVQSAVRR